MASVFLIIVNTILNIYCSLLKYDLDEEFHAELKHDSQLFTIQANMRNMLPVQLPHLQMQVSPQSQSPQIDQHHALVCNRAYLFQLVPYSDILNLFFMPMILSVLSLLLSVDLLPCAITQECKKPFLNR